jgi:hypothetical protein
MTESLTPAQASVLAEWSLLGAGYFWVLLLTILHLARTGLRDWARERAAIGSRSDWQERDLLRSFGPDLLPSWIQFPDTEDVRGDGGPRQGNRL